MFFIEPTANVIEYEKVEAGSNTSEAETEPKNEAQVGKRYATVPIPTEDNPVTLTLSLKVGDFEVKSEPFKIVSHNILFSIYIFNIRLYSSQCFK